MNAESVAGSDSDSNDTTIVGVATGTPDGGVAIVRLSGPDATRIASGLLAEGPRLPKPRRLARAALVIQSGAGEGAAAAGIEDGLIVVMPGPASFTGEDVVELHVHAGARNVRQVVEAALAAGARAAGPGEFTRRAFEHGRVTLEQAEGIAALIGARTDAALGQARRLVAGELGRRVRAVREQLGDLRCEVEANLDFPEDVDPADVRRWIGEAGAGAEVIEGWLGRFEAGRRARELARVVLAGPPNAGKSSLFNALLGRGRAIVSPRPGTTRDYVEAELELGPHGAVLVDTAGMRDAGPDELEEEGIARTREQIAGAEVVIWVEAADAEPDAALWPRVAETIAAHGASCLRVENKRDQADHGGPGHPSRAGWLGVSAQTGEGLDALRAWLTGWFQGGGDGEAAGGEPWIGLARHGDRARDALAAVRAAVAVLSDNSDRDAAPSIELAAFELGVAERRLGEITGEVDLGPVGASVLERIFSRFCIGK